MRHSYHVMQNKSVDKTISMGDISVNLDSLDLKKLHNEQAKDITEIEALQKQIEKMSESMTANDVATLDK